MGSFKFIVNCGETSSFSPLWTLVGPDGQILSMSGSGPTSGSYTHSDPNIAASLGRQLGDVVGLSIVDLSLGTPADDPVGSSYCVFFGTAFLRLPHVAMPLEEWQAQQAEWNATAIANRQQNLTPP